MRSPRSLGPIHAVFRSVTAFGLPPALQVAERVVHGDAGQLSSSPEGLQLQRPPRFDIFFPCSKRQAAELDKLKPKPAPSKEGVRQLS